MRLTGSGVLQSAELLKQQRRSRTFLHCPIQPLKLPAPSTVGILLCRDAMIPALSAMASDGNLGKSRYATTAIATRSDRSLQVANGKGIRLGERAPFWSARDDRRDAAAASGPAGS